MKKDMIKKKMRGYAYSSYGKDLEDCNDREVYHVLVKSLMEDIVPRWNQSLEKEKMEKSAYYLSAEFLMGRALSNNLINMDWLEDVEDLLEELDINYNRVEEAEEDAGLGNGGLGRLAACFLDSAASLDYSLHGYGIRYEFGMFKQKFVDGFQVEEAQDWLRDGDPWSIRREDKKRRVSFGDGDVYAVPYDMPIIGYGGTTINTLRLWKAEAIKSFDLGEYNREDYEASVREKNKAETISKVLYPNDTGQEGKKLRLKQQYFFVSASLQDLIEKHLEEHDSLDNFHDYQAIQLNDTHPAVAVPELMRLFTEEHGMDWDRAFEIMVASFAYTNHTILQEALEQWSVDLYKELLPDVYRMVERIDRQLVSELEEKGLDQKEIDDYRIIIDGNIKMAWLAIYGSHSTNGVAAIHSDILKKSELNNWYRLYPERFNNKTNGITQRRWLLKANRELSNLITELLGSEDWIRDLSQLKKLEKYKDNEEVLSSFMAIKQFKKVELADYMMDREGIKLDPNSIYDIQIKRLHEYKRQLLNAFHILDLYYRIKEDPDYDMEKTSFIFGAKSAPGYDRAKGIIKFINDIKDLVNNDPDVNDKINVVFVSNYDVSYAERLFSGADVSEQISTAGKEASGTGNMKFMLNGTPTLGTLDGANVEIVEEAGEENNFIFGLKVEEIEEMGDDYDPHYYYENVEGLKRVVDSLVDGTFDDGGSGIYKELHDSILKGADWHSPDAYYLMKDFESYREAHRKVNEAYRDRKAWARKCWINMCNAGKFSSDRTIDQYAKEIWGIRAL